MPILKIATGSISCLFALILTAQEPARSQGPPLGTESPASAADEKPSELDGDWVRVADGCADLPPDTERALPETGGGNRMSYFEILSIHGSNYQSRTMASPRCAADFKPEGPDFEIQRAQCAQGETSGKIVVDGPRHFTLNAANHRGINYWGFEHHDFEFEVINQNVLFVYGGDPINYCPDANHRIYFIRDPGT